MLTLKGGPQGLVSIGCDLLRFFLRWEERETGVKGGGVQQQSRYIRALKNEATGIWCQGWMMTLGVTGAAKMEAQIMVDVRLDGVRRGLANGREVAGGTRKPALDPKPLASQALGDPGQTEAAAVTGQWGTSGTPAVDT